MHLTLTTHAGGSVCGGLLAPESKHGRGALAEGADRLPARGKKNKSTTPTHPAGCRL